MCTVSNEARAIAQLIKQLSALKCERVLLEGGSYQNLLVVALRAAQLPVVIINPRRLRQWAQGLGQLAKTDRLDARMLALHGERDQPPVRELPDPQTQQLRALWVRREQLIEMLVMEQNRSTRPGCSITIFAATSITCANKSSARTTISIARCATRRSGTSTKSSAACRGVGRVLSCALLSQLPELARLNRAEAAARAGVARLPRTAEVCADRARSKAAAKDCDGRCTWRPSPRCAVTRRCEPFVCACAQSANPSRLRSLPPPANSS